MVLNNEIMRLAVIVAGAFALVWFINKMNGNVLDNMENGNGNGNGNGNAYVKNPQEKPMVSGGYDGMSGSELNQQCFPMAQELSANDLLPGGNDESAWPNGDGTLQDQNFLFAGHHIGINTVGQSLRNANKDLRSEPPNPQVQVSPWQQTTIGPDQLRRPLEIGSSY